MKTHFTKTNLFVGLGTLISLALLVVVVTGLYPAPSAAQTQPADETLAPLPRTITVVGEGSTSAEPDTAEINIGVQVSGSTVEAATQEAQTMMEAVLTALREQGVSDQDIQTSGFNVFAEPPPVEPAAQQQAETTSYQVSNNVRVTLHNLEQVSPVLDAAIAAGANNIYGVNFSLEETEQFEGEARREAMADAQAEAQELADLAGVTLGQVISVSEVLGMPPFFQPSAFAAAEGVGGGGPISPGEMEVNSRLQVVFALE